MSCASKLSIITATFALALSACFDSDELGGTAETTAGSGGDDTVAEYEDTSGGDEYDENWTAEGTGPDETTCRDAIDCLITCQSILIFNPQPEPDLSCFLECDMGLNTEEAYKLIKLAECIGNKCADEGACGPESSDSDCLTCIAANGSDLEPPGCIEEAAACQ